MDGTFPVNYGRYLTSPPATWHRPYMEVKFDYTPFGSLVAVVVGVRGEPADTSAWLPVFLSPIEECKDTDLSMVEACPAYIPKAFNRPTIRRDFIMREAPDVDEGAAPRDTEIGTDEALAQMFASHKVGAHSTSAFRFSSLNTDGRLASGGAPFLRCLGLFMQQESLEALSLLDTQLDAKQFSFFSRLFKSELPDYYFRFFAAQRPVGAIPSQRQALVGGQILIFRKHSHLLLENCSVDPTKTGCMVHSIFRVRSQKRRICWSSVYIPSYIAGIGTAGPDQRSGSLYQKIAAQLVLTGCLPASGISSPISWIYSTLQCKLRACQKRKSICVITGDFNQSLDVDSDEVNIPTSFCESQPLASRLARLDITPVIHQMARDAGIT